MTELKIAGTIKPAEFKDPVKLLRNIADDIEAGNYGEVETIVVGLRGETYETFGGGKLASLQDCGFLFGVCATRLFKLPFPQA
jgi:hypothetical protein